jgi:LuxR family maltose regulon positive regulatory protein
MQADGIVVAGGRDRIAAPQPSADLALRTQIIEHLSEPNVRVGVITAPAGYGKTSHAAAWAAQQDRAVAWLDLEDVHRDAVVLLADLVFALAAVTDFDGGHLAARGISTSQFTTSVVSEFGRALHVCRVPFVLVLDDVHRLNDQSSTDLLDALVSNVPTRSTVVLVGRALRLQALGRLRVDSTVTEVGVGDLALDADDVAVILAGMGIKATAERVEQLVEATEGWPVGVRLAGLGSLADGLDDLGPADLSGRESSINDYIDSEWLWGLTAEDRDFLMRVSVLDWLSGTLCNEVLDRHDSGDVLHRVFTNRLLVIPLDRRESAYRMHVLLRDALQAEFERVDATSVREVHRRASVWFEEAGDIDRAIRHALAAHDLDRVELLVVENTPSYNTNGLYATINHWVESLPHDRLLRSPGLCLSAALAAWGQGDAEKLSIWIRLGEEATEPAAEGDSAARPCLRVLRSSSSVGPARSALDDARAAYESLRPGIWHAASCAEYGAWAWMIGDDIAQELLTEGAEEADVFGASTIEAGCSAMLAMVAFDAGDFARSWPLVERARRVVNEQALDRAPGAAIVSAMSALAAASRGDPEGARSHWRLARGQLAHLRDRLGWVNVQARVALAHTSLLLGDRVGAETVLGEGREFLIKQPDATNARRQVAQLEELARHLRRHRATGSSALTTAELRVLHHLPTNLSLAEIGARLYVSRYTVKTHCESIYRKLMVNSRSDAVVAARRIGLLQESEASSD